MAIRVCKNPKCGKRFRLRRPPKCPNNTWAAILVHRLYCYRTSCEEKKVWREQNSRRYKFLRRRWNKKHGKAYNRRYRLKFYGHTEESFENQRKIQKNRCAICREIFREMPHIDHKAGTTKSHRGLLCVNCNTMIGQAREKINVLKKAIEYLKKWEKNNGISLHWT